MKIALIASAAALVILSACSSNSLKMPEGSSVASMKQVCIYNNPRYNRFDVDSKLVEAFNKQGVKARVVQRGQYVDRTACPNVFKYKYRGNGAYIRKAELVLRTPEGVGSVLRYKGGSNPNITSESPNMQAQWDEAIAMLLGKKAVQ